MEHLKLTTRQLAALRRESSDDPNKIKLALEKTGAKQYELARACRLPESRISEVITGKSIRPSLHVARLIAQAFGACIEDIFPPPCAAPKRRAA
jgi:DNA-binding XRE family transcriptional regulator